VCHRGSSLAGGEDGVVDGTSRMCGWWKGTATTWSTSSIGLVDRAPHAQESSEPATTTLAVSGIEQQEHPRV
jgi:hypothetical protein